MTKRTLLAYLLATLTAPLAFAASTITDSSINNPAAAAKSAPANTSKTTQAAVQGPTWSTISSGLRAQARSVTAELTSVTSDLQGSDTNGDVHAKQGTGAALMAEFGHSAVLFETGLAYAQYGARVANSTSPMTLTVNLDYFSIPLAAKYYLNNRAANDIYVKAGVAPSWLAYKNTDIESARITASNNNFSVKAYNTQMIAGVGGRLNSSAKQSVVFELSYSRSFEPAIPGYEIYNSSYLASIGYGFDL